MTMNYIKLINEFWRLNAMESFSCNEISVYLYLLNQCNLRRWQNPFTITLHQMEVALCASRKSLKVSIKRLEKRKLLATKFQRNRPIILTLTDCNNTTREQSEAQSREQSGNNQGHNPGKIAPHIEREKRKEKRQLKNTLLSVKKNESENFPLSDNPVNREPQESTANTPSQNKQGGEPMVHPQVDCRHKAGGEILHCGDGALHGVGIDVI